MPLTPTELAATALSSDATSYAYSLSATPTTDALIIASYFHGAGGAVAAPTVSGCGLTWAEIVSTDIAGLRRLSVWRALGTVTSSGPVVFNHGSSSQTRSMAQIIQWAGAATSGTNGSGAIVQSKSSNNASPGSTNPNVTYTAGFGSTTNVSYFSVGGLLASTGALYTPVAGYTKFTDVASNAPVSNMMSAWQVNSPTGGIASAESTASALWTIAALEIKESTGAAANAAVNVSHLALLGVS